MKILLVEDDARTADFILKGLQQSGYTTVHAADGRDGLFKATTESCDLAVVDIMLPGLDGFTLIEKLRAAGIKLPVIVLSARSSVDDKIRALQRFHPDRYPAAGVHASGIPRAECGPGGLQNDDHGTRVGVQFRPADQYCGDPDVPAPRKT